MVCIHMKTCGFLMWQNLQCPKIFWFVLGLKVSSVNSTFAVLENTAKLKPVSKKTALG